MALENSPLIMGWETLVLLFQNAIRSDRQNVFSTHNLTQLNINM